MRPRTCHPVQSTPPQPQQPRPSHPPHPVSPGPAHAATLPAAEASPSVAPPHLCVSHVLPQAAIAPRPRPLGMRAAPRHARHPAPVPHAPASAGPGHGARAMFLVVVPCALVPATPCNQHHHSPRNRARRTLPRPGCFSRVPPQPPAHPPACRTHLSPLAQVKVPKPCFLLLSHAPSHLPPHAINTTTAPATAPVAPPSPRQSWPGARRQAPDRWACAPPRDTPGTPLPTAAASSSLPRPGCFSRARAARTCCRWCRPIRLARAACRRTTRPCRSHRQTCACPCPAAASPFLATVRDEFARG